MMMKTLLGATVALAAMVPAAASAQRVQSGSANGLSWTAQSRIIGQTSTGTNTTLGDSRYLAANSSGYSGSVGLLMTYANGSRFVCSGTLLNGGRSVLTAAHCVSDGGGAKAADLVRTQVFFANEAASLSTTSIYAVGAPGVTSIDVGNYFVNSAYTGEVIDQNDIAVLQLRSFAPSFAQTYGIYTDDIKSAQFNVNGFGTRSSVGGAQGNTPPFNAGTGRRRQGDNIYDYAWGDSLFEGFFTDRDVNGENFFGTADVEFSYISDFDNGTLAQDQARRIANALGLGAIGDANFNNQGLGAMEVGIAGGDSGGGAFINGQIASVNSYGLTFGTNFGDFSGGLNAGWGEFSGYVPTFIHQDFIAGAMAGSVPEPATWALMILGMGAVGGAMRRRAKTTVRFA